jgi:putative ABC transport system permease protein
VLVGLIDLPRAKYPDARQWQLYWTDLIENVRAVPGVADASIVNALPFWGYSTMQVTDGEQEPFAADVLMVGPKYFSTMGVPLLRGRDIEDLDGTGNPTVAIINQAMLRRMWPDGPAVGKRIIDGASGGALSAEIVGVVGDIRQRGYWDSPQPTVYLPYAQYPSPAATLVVRASEDAHGMIRAVADRVEAADETVTLSDVMTMRAILASSIAVQRLVGMVFLAFASLSLSLVVVGVFALAAYTLNSRMREIAIRLALGAAPRATYRLLLIEMGAPVLVGIVVGSGLSLGLGWTLTGLLFGVGPTDPLTLVSCAVGLLLAGFVAVAIPLRRATKAGAAVLLRA